MTRTRTDKARPNATHLDLVFARQWLSLTTDRDRAEYEKFTETTGEQFRAILLRLVDGVLAGQDVRDDYFYGSDPRPQETATLEHALAVTYILAEQLRAVPRGGVPKRQQDLALVALGDNARDSKVERALGNQRKAAEEFLGYYRHPLGAYRDVAHAFGGRREQVAKWLWSLRKPVKSSPQKKRANSRGR